MDRGLVRRRLLRGVAGLVLLPGIALRAFAQKREARLYMCRNTECRWVYDPALGDPDRSIRPGVRFEDLPDTWVCPKCESEKANFFPYWE
jgi:rubredoxin